MGGTVRSLTGLIIASMAILVVLDLLEPPGAGRGEHSVTVAVTLIGTLGLVQLIASVIRRHPHVWKTASPLWRRPVRDGTIDPVPAVRELEALIITAATGGPRARGRLDRRLDALGCGTLASRLQSTDPSSDEVVDALEQLLTEAEATHDR